MPTEAATDEVRQMIEGKLAEDEREPRNVQVVMMGEASLALWDDNGEFLRANRKNSETTNPLRSPREQSSRRRENRTRLNTFESHYEPSPQRTRA